MVDEQVVWNCESGVRNCPRCVRSMSLIHRRETHAYCARVGRYKFLHKGSIELREGLTSVAL